MQEQTRKALLPAWKARARSFLRVSEKKDVRAMCQIGIITSFVSCFICRPGMLNPKIVSNQHFVDRIIRQIMDPLVCCLF